ncbi:hypothetical protein [Flavobacterium hydrophilum]|uniref:Uncharacterized protein n=1 Tax=Flavobacterium hydrophilum TaxID=2211445 RepID=A0A2V4CA42_9FLAO|nr:hypothetical protein [Flavobacterium hydrophilum]PXY47003.1 hypothetical protein DMB68_07605 [Flavobacterium hydrophilum]
MYAIQITKETESWIAAICPLKEQALEYLQTLPEVTQEYATCYEIHIKTFPFVIIEHTVMQHDSALYFEFATLEELQERIAFFRVQMMDDPDHLYFKYYFIDEAYFQVASEQNYMQYLKYTFVNNSILEEPYMISVFHEEIKKYVADYDISGLDKLFEQTKNDSTSKLEKKDLAINGYDNLFWTMYYDHASGKLTEAGIACLLPIVEKIEILREQKKWEHRSYAFHMMLEMACKNKPETAFELLKKTVEAFKNYLISQPAEKLNIHRLVSLAYQWMIETEPANALLYWQNAVLEIKKAIDYDPENASWSSLLELIYFPFNEDKKISGEQEKEQKIVNTKIQKFEKDRGAVIAYQIALAYQNLEEFLNWKKVENVFPETLAFQWAEKALAYIPEELSRTSLYECAEFFSKTGAKANRVDFLEKTISLYEHILNTYEDSFLEIFYIVSILREIARIHLQNNQQELADSAITEARLMFENNLEKVKSNASLNLRYAEFLEYCYTYNGNIKKPALSELKGVAEEIEIESKGFYSYPYGLLTCIALLESNETEAILQATKSLILHELCAKATFYDLFEQFKNSEYNQIKDFLQDTILFMEEVEKNYYYNPELSWEKLNKMSNEALTVYWEGRKDEIRNRLSFDTE